MNSFQNTFGVIHLQGNDIYMIKGNNQGSFRMVLCVPPKAGLAAHQLWKPVHVSSQEAGAVVKESGLFLGACHLEYGKLVSHSPFSGKLGDSRLKAHFVENGGFMSQSPSPPLRGDRGFL